MNMNMVLIKSDTIHDSAVVENNYIASRWDIYCIYERVQYNIVLAAHSSRSHTVLWKHGFTDSVFTNHVNIT